MRVGGTVKRRPKAARHFCHLTELPAQQRERGTTSYEFSFELLLVDIAQEGNPHTNLVAQYTYEIMQSSMFQTSASTEHSLRHF